jgi:hypothetical protein
MAAIVALNSLCTIGLGLLMIGLLRNHAELMRKSEHNARREVDLGRPVHPSLPSPIASASEAADLVGADLSGNAVQIGVVGRPYPTLLVFLSSGCLTCNGFWEVLAGTEVPQTLGEARVVVVTKGESEESVSAVREAAGACSVPVIMSSGAWSAYSVPGSPYFVYVDGPSGRVYGEGTGAKWEQVQGMLERSLADAGLTFNRDDQSGVTHSQRLAEGSQSRAQRIDDELTAAGIYPGHPSLYPSRGMDHGGGG